MTSGNIIRSTRNTAMDLLSRREHSRQELSNKLLQREYTPSEISLALDRLEQDGLLSDQRFAECFVSQRVARGYGPIRIRHEMQQRGIDETIVETLLSSSELDWTDAMQQQRKKKFGAELPREYKEKTKQARFLQNRGFSPESVMRLFR
ncbi:MAG: regulatory protein RecX [Gammaproteobacteria bacterium]|nr:regulatory protein RecX [Gammaproteobacteria bacterium]MBL6999757.1 regulatory protein RecX [Gammaproteobacteria bacterium]